MKWVKLCKVLIFALFLNCRVLAQDDVPDTMAMAPPVMEDASPIQTQASSNFDTVDSTAGKVQVRKVPDSVLGAVRKDEDYWYANLVPQKKTEDKPRSQEEKSLFEKPWFTTLFWIIVIGGFVAVLSWYLASSNIRLFRKPSTVLETPDEELITEDIFELDYDKEIQAAIASKNFRLATRLMYLRTLKELSDRELIQYKNERTNSDYLFQLSGTKYYRDFFRLTRDFEYTWYGEFQLSSEAFEVVQKDFSTFKQQMQ